MNNSKINKKLMKYSALATGLTGVSSIASSQIIHTDVNPDTLLNQHLEAYELDFNNDATVDFTLTFFNYSYYTAYSSYIGSYQVRMGRISAPATGSNGWRILSGSTYYPMNMPSGSIINGTGVFSANSSALIGGRASIFYSYSGSTYNSTYQAGNFLGTEGFIGVRFDISGQTHHGWIRVEMDVDANQLIVKEYAYNAQAGGDVLAGQTTGIEQDPMDNITIKPSPGRVIISNYAELGNGVIEIFNLQGQKVKEPVLTPEETIISTSDLSTGVYIMNISFDNGSLSKKLYIR